MITDRVVVRWVGVGGPFTVVWCVGENGRCGISSSVGLASQLKVKLRRYPTHSLSIDWQGVRIGLNGKISLAIGSGRGSRARVGNS